MELGWISWIIVIIGALMLIAEAVMPGYFIIVPGTILVIVGALLLIAPDMLTSPLGIVILAIITLIVSYLTIQFYKRLAPGQKPLTVSSDTLVGKKGEVLVDVEPGNINGKVKLDQQTWSATSDTKIPKGEKIVVQSSKGVHVFVVREK
jgi:membrane protein implicated in regulation of membrane protease activity